MKGLLLFLFSIFLINSYGQKTIQGTVVELKSQRPLIGCSIYNVNNQTGTISNENGEYRIQVSIGDLIQYSFVGMEVKEVYVTALSDTIDIALSYQVNRIKNVVISSTYGAKNSVLYNKNYEKEKNTPKIKKRIDDYRSYMTPMAFLSSPITALYYTFSPRLRLKMDYLEKIQKREYADMKYNTDFISIITKVEDEQELKDIRAYCYFSEDLILNSSHYELAVMIKECYLDYLDHKNNAEKK